jgi:hypothetical protein
MAFTREKEESSAVEREVDRGDSHSPSPRSRDGWRKKPCAAARAIATEAILSVLWRARPGAGTREELDPGAYLFLGVRHGDGGLFGAPESRAKECRAPAALRREAR